MVEETKLLECEQEAIKKAAETGGYCLIGKRSTVIYYVNETGGETRLACHNMDSVKKACIEAGIIVIDASPLDNDTLSRLLIKTPIPAITKYDLEKVNDESCPVNFVINFFQIVFCDCRYR